VYFGIVRTTRILPVAVKMIKVIERADESRKSAIELQAESLQRELDMLANIRGLHERQHPNLLQLIGASTTSDHQLCIVTEYCECGSLGEYLKEKLKNDQFINEIVFDTTAHSNVSHSLFISFIKSA
jgi:serine/threonine protein kinase